MKKFILLAVIMMATVSCASQSDWTKMWSVAPADNFCRAEMDAHFAAHPELWKAVFDFLNAHQLDTLEEGRYEIIEGQAFANVSEYTPKLPEKCRFENHHNFIDLQYVIVGEEKIGVVRNPAAEEKEPYNPDKDIAFFGTEQEGAAYEIADSSKYFVFFPEDLHRPSMAASEDPAPVKKIVVKIRYK